MRYSPARIYRAIRQRALPFAPAFRFHASVRGHQITLVVDTAMDLYRAESYESKEPETLDWIDSVVQADDVFFDVGANVGLYGIYAAVARRARVWAFEPEAQNVGRLQQHIVENNLVGRVHPYVLALTDQEGLDVLQLHGPVLGPASALHAFGSAIDYQGNAFSPIATQGLFGTTLDLLTTRWGLPVPNHLKIDVDGLEPKILAGARHLLTRPELRTLLIEIEEGHEGVADVVLANGFREVRRQPTLMNQRVVGYNCIFARA